MKNSITIKDLKDKIIQHYIYNQSLDVAGFPPLSVRLLGSGGIGKTSAILQAAKELAVRLNVPEVKMKKLNLGQITDPSDLIGFPKTKTYITSKSGESKWVWDTMLHQYKDWTITDKTVTDYAFPQWVEYLSEGGILVLDDYNRTSQRLMQAVMEIIDRREFYSWKLPANVMIVLTGNPSGEGYNVMTEDKAQTTRYVTYNVDFDFQSWREWAKSVGIREDFIDFIALNHIELFDDKSENSTNIRQWTKLFALASIEKLDDSFFYDFAAACVGTNVPLLINHLNEVNRIEVTAEDIVDTDINQAEDILRKLIFKDDYYKNSVSSIILTRIINYLIKKGENKGILGSSLDNFMKLFARGIFNNEAFNRVSHEFALNRQSAAMRQLGEHEYTKEYLTNLLSTEK